MIYWSAWNVWAHRLSLDHYHGISFNVEDAWKYPLIDCEIEEWKSILRRVSTETNTRGPYEHEWSWDELRSIDSDVADLMKQQENRLRGLV